MNNKSEGPGAVSQPPTTTQREPRAARYAYFTSYREGAHEDDVDFYEAVRSSFSPSDESESSHDPSSRRSLKHWRKWVVVSAVTALMLIGIGVGAGFLARRKYHSHATSTSITSSSSVLSTSSPKITAINPERTSSSTAAISTSIEAPITYISIMTTTPAAVTETMTMTLTNSTASTTGQ